ncbi:hypothetical protein, partial [Rheinheimera sp.]|uniref:hypothetical protein n=1 Tax=Rheinheimera sp. TaxID=1869214 RepID=UPI0040489B17
FRASALNSAVCVLRIFFVDIIHLVKRLYSLSKVSKSVGKDQSVCFNARLEFLQKANMVLSQYRTTKILRFSIPSASNLIIYIVNKPSSAKVLKHN